MIKILVKDLEAQDNSIGVTTAAGTGKDKLSVHGSIYCDPHSTNEQGHVTYGIPQMQADMLRYYTGNIWTGVSSAGATTAEPTTLRYGLKNPAEAPNDNSELSNQSFEIIIKSEEDGYTASAENPDGKRELVVLIHDPSKHEKNLMMPGNIWIEEAGVELFGNEPSNVFLSLPKTDASGAPTSDDWKLPGNAGSYSHDNNWQNILIYGNDVLVTAENYNPETLHPTVYLQRGLINLPPIIGKAGNRRVHYDLTHELTLPFEQSHLKSYNTDITNAYVGINSEYNWKNNYYEDFLMTSESRLMEAAMPNIYVFFSELMRKGIYDSEENDFANNNSYYNDLITLLGNIAGVTTGFLENPLNPLLFENPNIFKKYLEENGVDPYYDAWTTAMKTITFLAMNAPFDENMKRLMTKYSNIIFPSTKLDILKAIEDHKNLFPMYTSLEFTTGAHKELIKLLDNTKFSTTLVRKMMELSAISWVHDEDQSYSQVLNLAPPLSPGENQGIWILENDTTAWGTTSDEINPFYEQVRTNKWIKDPFLGINHNLSLDSKLIKRSSGKYLSIKRFFNNLQDDISDQNPGISTSFNEMPNISLDQWPVIMGNAADESDIFLNNSNYFFNYLCSIAFNSSFGELERKHQRTYKEIIEGKKAHSETLYYKVCKHDKETGAILQYIYVPNSSDPDKNIIKYIDTQVRFDNEYIYKIYAGQAVFGQKYQYKGLGTDEQYANAHLWVTAHLNVTGQGVETENMDDIVIGREDERNAVAAAFNVETWPYTVLLETLYFSQDVEDGLLSEGEVTSGALITDDPPPPPDVNFVPYKNEKNKMLIMFQKGIGELEEKPIWLTNAELLTKINSWMVSQGLGSLFNPEYGISPDIQDYDSAIEILLGNSKINFNNLYDKLPKILYKNDDSGGCAHACPVGMEPDLPIRYEIYRTTEKPIAKTSDNAVESYQKAFKGKLIHTTTGESSFLVDDLVPNTKYYYTFRAIDSNENFSNPTVIYEVEIILNSGAIWPIINIVDFDRSIPGEVSKSVKKYIQIVPTYTQSALDEENQLLKLGDILDDIGAGAIPVIEDYTQNLQVGYDDEDLPLYERIFNTNQKFRIRLTSKSSGKKFDLIVDFQTKKVNNLSS